MLDIERILFILLLILASIGVYMLSDLFPKGRAKVRFKRSGLKSFLSIFSDLNNADQDQIFRNVGIKLSMKKYMAIRNLIVVILALCALSELSSGRPHASYRILLMTLLLVFVSEPKESILGKKSFFTRALELARSEYLNRKDDELIAVITQMKNIASVGHSESADSLIQNLMRFTRILKPIFARTLSLLRRASTVEAKVYFNKEVGTKLGSDFAAILPKLDELDAAAFKNQLELLLSTVKERRATKKYARQQTLSNLVFTSASIGVFLIFADFMYIVYTDLMKSFQY